MLNNVFKIFIENHNYVSNDIHTIILGNQAAQ